MKKLKSCPFCGEIPKTTKHFKEELWLMIHRCPYTGIIQFDWTDDEEQIINKWNHRIK